MDGYFYTGLGFGIPALITYLLYRRRRDYCKILEGVKLFSIGDELNEALKESPEQCLPYASISGLVKADLLPIQLSMGERTANGVIHKMTVTEHKSEWSKHSRAWDDVRRNISNTQNSVPFSLESENKQSRVAVVDPLQANNLTYTTVSTKFEPVVSSLSNNLFSLASGEKIKGYETTDEMLLEGTKLTALGKIEISGGKVVIGPTTSSLKYILSTDSLRQIVRSETNFAKFLRGLSVFFAICSSVLLSVWLYRHLKKWYQTRQAKASFETLQNDVLELTGDECVVCMDRPHNVVILDCGHICVCRECAQIVTVCPVCRAHVVRIVPTFVST